MIWAFLAAFGALWFVMGWQVKGFLIERAEYAAEEKRWATWDAQRADDVLPDRRG